MNDTFMKEKPVFGLVLSMSLPMVLSMMVNALYNIVDSYFVARISEDAMTALSLVYPVQNLISATAIGFGVGINAVIAFFLGAGDKKKANQAATMGMFWSLVQGLILSIVCILIVPKFLTLFTDDATVIDYAIRYSRIAFLFGMIISSGLSFEKTFQAVGRMKVSMLSMMAGCISNIVLDPILIFGLGPFPAMGIEGAALATGAGQVITLVIYIIIYMVKPIPVKICISGVSFKGGISRRLYSIGVPAILNMALPSLLISALNGILAEFSQSYVLVLGAYYKLQTFLYLTSSGIVQGIRPLIGYNYGAREYARVHRDLSDSPWHVIGCYDCGNGSLPLHSGKPYWNLYQLSRDCRDWKDSASDYQRRIYYFCGICHFLRCTGRTEHGLPFAADFHAPLHPHYYPGGIFVKPDTGSERRMACLLGDRVDYCRCGVADL